VKAGYLSGFCRKPGDSEGLLTNAFSKKVENRLASLATRYMHYNFVKIHQSLRVTPAMAAGVTDPLWSIEDLRALLA